jgi:hypothetical protein
MTAMRCNQIIFAEEAGEIDGLDVVRVFSVRDESDRANDENEEPFVLLDLYP